MAAAVLRPALAVVCLTAVASGEEPTHLLRYRFEQGATLRYREVTDGTYHARRAEFVDEGTTYAETDKSAVVASVDGAGVATLRLTVDRARLAPTSNGKELPQLDTAAAVPVPLEYAEIARAVGEPLAEIRVDARGAYIDGKPLLGAEALAAIAKGETGGDAVTRNFLIPLPEEPAAVGHRWDQRFEGRVSLGGENLKRSVTLRRRFKLVAVEGDLATISVRTTVLTPLRDPQALTQLATREPRGEIVFDVAAGRLVSHRSWADGQVLGFAGANSLFKATSRQSLTLVGPGDGAEGAVARADD